VLWRLDGAIEREQLAATRHTAPVRGMEATQKPVQANEDATATHLAAHKHVADHDTLHCTKKDIAAVDELQRTPNRLLSARERYEKHKADLAVGEALWMFGHDALGNVLSDLDVRSRYGDFENAYSLNNLLEVAGWYGAHARSRVLLRIDEELKKSLYCRIDGIAPDDDTTELTEEIVALLGCTLGANFEDMGYDISPAAVRAIRLILEGAR
jgi:hypothetical protein